MILLKELKLNNFLSHEKTEITFSKNEKLLLDGRSGSGKSSITEAVIWVLYGKGRSENRSLIRRGAKSASVSLKLNDGQQESIITRTVSTSGKNTLIVTQNTGSEGQFLPIERVGIKDTQDWIEGEYLKASYELFTNSICYPQDNENSFVKSSAGDRKDLLLEIIRAGNFDQLYDETRRAITANELGSAVAVSKIETHEATIKNSEEIVKNIDKYKQDQETAAAEVEALGLVEKDLNNKLQGISQLSDRIKEKKYTISILLKSIENLDLQDARDQKEISDYKATDIDTARSQVKQIEEAVIEAAKIEEELKESALSQQKINAHLANRPNVIDYSGEIEEINKRLIPLVKETGKCPSGDACPFVAPIKGQIDFLTEQIIIKSDKSVKEMEALEKWEKEAALLPPVKDSIALSKTYHRLKQYRELIETLSPAKEVVAKYEAFGKRMTELFEAEVPRRDEKNRNRRDLVLAETQLKELEDQYSTANVNKLNTDLSNIRISIQKSQKVKEEASVNLSLATSAQLAIKDASDWLIRLRAEVLKSVEDKEALELLKEALSPRGIKAVVIDYLIPQLETRINNVLGQMSDFKIRLDTQKALSSDEGVKEGLFITIINDRGEELAFENYSGGERVKITMAISEALASLLNQVGFRILDEAISSLDNESTQSFIEVLTKLQQNFPQVIAVSHIPEVKDVFEKKITVTKINGVSKII